MDAPQLGQRVDGKAIDVVQPQCSLVLGVQTIDRVAKRGPKHLGALGVEKSTLLLAPDRFRIHEVDRRGLPLGEPGGVRVALPQDAMRGPYRGDFQPSSETPTPLIPVDCRSAAFSDKHDLQGLGVRLISKRGRQLHPSEGGPDRSAVATYEELRRPTDACAAGGGQEQVVRVLWGGGTAVEAFRERFE